MKTQRVGLFFAVSLFSVLCITLWWIFPMTSAAAPDRLAAKLQILGQLEHDSIKAPELSWNPDTNSPSFIRLRLSTGKLAKTKTNIQPGNLAFEFVKRYGALFSINEPAKQLELAGDETDNLGMRHVNFRQVCNGIEVYGGAVKVHFNADSSEVVAVSSSFAPDVELCDRTNIIDPGRALEIALKAMPNGVLLSGPKLTVYVSKDLLSVRASNLAWIVELRDESLPARNFYVVDAASGDIIDVLSRLYNARNRQTYNANHSTNLPGTLSRSESDPVSNNTDVDNAHKFAGMTYGYFWLTHKLDSFDGAGSTITSTVHYGKDYRNAFWNGEQMVYGDGLAVKDVVAHELTHAVTEHSVNGGLEYRWQSGALNESFSDIFGAMVDRQDWLIGEDLPASMLNGRNALRDISNPGRLGQPAHSSKWVQTCSDNEGVHTNSGIPNKAYFNIASAITKAKAELIFYRSLSVYLDMQSSMEDSRAAAIQSAQDIYGADSPESGKVVKGFNAVGLDGRWNPPENSCTCAASVTLSDHSIFPRRLRAIETGATLYRVRDELLESSAFGKRYRRLYEGQTGRISALILRDASLRASAGEVLQLIMPGLRELVDGRGGAMVTQEMVDEVLSLLQRLSAADNAQGGGKLSRVIESEMKKLDWSLLPGMTFENAWKSMSGLSAVESVLIDE